MSVQVSAKRCPLFGPAPRSVHRRYHLGRTVARTSNKCCLKRREGKECPLCSRNCTKALIRRYRRITTQIESWLSPRAADQHRQRVSAQRRSSRHQVGSCEDRASTYFDKEGKSFLAGHKILLTGIRIVYIPEYSV